MKKVNCPSITPLKNSPPSRVRAIVLFPEVTEEVEIDPDDTPI